MNLSTFFAVKFESGAMRFSGENCSGAGALSKQGFLPCPPIIRNSKWRTQNPTKSLKKKLLRQKDDNRAIYTRKNKTRLTQDAS